MFRERMFREPMFWEHMRLIGTMAVIALAAVSPAAAQEWPARPVTMVIPFAAGGALDVLGRIFQPALSDALRTPIVIENVGGAGDDRRRQGRQGCAGRLSIRSRRRQHACGKPDSLQGPA